MEKLIFCLMLCACNLAIAQNSEATQDLVQLKLLAEDFLKQQTLSYPGLIDISTTQIDRRLKLPACDNPRPFLPSGSRIVGKVNVGIRCTTPKPWSIYLAAQIKVSGDYYVTAKQISQGQAILPTDILKVSGELSTLPAGAITNPEQVVGKSLSNSLASGSIVRLDAIKTTPIIQQGQSVKIISAGPGFQVTTDGVALNSAHEGQVARAKTISGQVLSGVAKLAGSIEINY
ncbi:flagellar basal body P-ring formation chaperone FlgA [Undibacterium sp. Ren11W]|uniref:flagellar basal body P-ring formation chaperone FlgA n=1 Tax=Undibacterium sp. Ren11W TaxID=3413045 RepID=UPI003BF33407